MEIKEIEQKIAALTDRVCGNTEKGILGIVPWIKDNPHITDPNAYEIIDCNVELAEIMSELGSYYDEHGYPTLTRDGTTLQQATYRKLPVLHPSLQPCFFGIWKMEELRDITHHPFFTTKEANDMICKLKLHQMQGTYTLPATEEDRRIKRELICKSMSVPFYIWQVQRTEPNYKYDNQTEFDTMKEMFGLYEASEEPCQFKSQISGLFTKIEKDYKYSEQQTTNTTKNNQNKNRKANSS